MTANALVAIVDALRSVPGRKAVVLFSEGLYKTEATEDRFLSVVNAANRASVSIYAVEAAGLQVKTYESLEAQEIRSVASLSMAQQASGRDVGGGSMTRGLEQTEDLVKYHPRGSLEWISNSTGGVFVRDTNDITGALQRIGSDLGNYYLLGYTPKNESFDGRFRKIAVRVKRKGVEVRARSGYFAVRTIGPVLTHVAAGAGSPRRREAAARRRGVRRRLVVPGRERAGAGAPTRDRAGIRGGQARLSRLQAAARRHPGRRDC